MKYSNVVQELQRRNSHCSDNNIYLLDATRIGVSILEFVPAHNEDGAPNEPLTTHAIAALSFDLKNRCYRYAHWQTLRLVHADEVYETVEFLELHDQSDSATFASEFNAFCVACF